MERRKFLKSTVLSTTGMMAWGSFLFIGGCSATDSNSNTLNLTGTWNFQLDPEDAGINQEWFKKELSHQLELPGSIQEQGFGDDITADTEWMVWNNYYDELWFTSPIFSEYRKPGNIHFIEWLQPEKHYVGPAWFQREVDIPQELEDKRLILHLERCHWETTLWVNGEQAGSRNSLATHHEYDVTGMLMPGNNKLSIRVDNSMIVEVGMNAHTVTDHTQSAWNGVIGRNELQATSTVWIENVQVFPDLDTNSAELEIKVGNNTSQYQKGQLKVRASDFNTSVDHPISPIEQRITLRGQDEKSIKLTLPLGEDAQRWDEFNPALYKLQVDFEVLDCVGIEPESYETTFGMREVNVQDPDILVNGRPVMLRGNLECCIFPKTGYPPTDVKSWLRIYQKHKAYGFNHVRFHSWCPPEAAFEAADEAGIYIQAEAGVWNQINSDEQREFLLEESERILQRYGNHPSFIMMGLGNEGWCQKDIMNDLIKRWKQDDRRIYTGLANSNDSIIDEYDYFVGREMKSQRIRFQGGWPPKPDNNWLLIKRPNTNTDFQKTVELYDKPLITHEIGQRCSYPSLDQGEKYSGSFSAGYLKTARDQLKERGMSDQWKDFIRASGRWQIELYKEEIEACLRTTDLSGFHLLQLHDFPGQSGALVGVLDAFWDEKGYCGPDEFSSFCSPTVALALMKKRVWTDDEVFTARMQLSHYGKENLGSLTIDMRVEDSEGKEVAQETKKTGEIATGNLHDIGDIRHELSSLPAPGRYHLTADMKDISESKSWNFWVFPSNTQKADTGNVSIEHAWSPKLETRINNGETILLQPEKEDINGDLPPCFLPMYWIQFGLDKGESQAMGLLCDPSHPVFGDFPTEYHTDWHWWELLSKTPPMVFDSYDHDAPWPKEFRPLVQLIDGWETNRKLGVLAEARMGQGKIIMSSMDLSRSLETRPVARQFRKSVLSYMNSDAFEPETEIESKHLNALLQT